MAIQWHEPQQQRSNGRVASPAAGASNPWFGVSMGLLGVIVGYVIAVSGIV